MIPKAIRNGIYLVIDPSMESGILLEKLKLSMDGKIMAVQIWDNFNTGRISKELVKEIISLCHPKNIPVLINNRWDLLQDADTALDGIHLDGIPDNFPALKKSLRKKTLIGITCSNDMSVVRWAVENGLDYISFCSIFPSSTANSCELVTFDTIKEARRCTSLPIFLAGGITPENTGLLSGLDYSGIAVISGIMNADDPVNAIELYHQQMKLKQVR